jgi:hypothetical protein
MNNPVNSAPFDLRDLFYALRVMPGVEERIPGIYRHGGASLLHFHESTSGCYADLRVEGYWMRYPVNTEMQRLALLELLKAALPGAKTAAPLPSGHGQVTAHGMKLEPRARTPAPPEPRPGRRTRTPEHHHRAPH